MKLFKRCILSVICSWSCFCSFSYLFAKPFTMGAYLEQVCHRKTIIFHVFWRCERVPHLVFSPHFDYFKGIKIKKMVFWMAVFLSLCSLRHWVKCSAVSCCSPVAEYGPLQLIHSVNKSRLVWLTCSAAIGVVKTASRQPMAARAAREGGAKLEERERGQGVLNVSRENNPPTKKTSSLLSLSFVPCCHWSRLHLCMALCKLNNGRTRLKVIAAWFCSPINT